MSGTNTTARYNVDLEDLHSDCEANYVRLMRLFPDYERTNEQRILAGEGQVSLTVTERARYTTTLRLTHHNALSNACGRVKLDVRLYHDAKMAEVVGVPSNRRIEGRYSYPNDQMFQRDEKRQQNRYVAELLSFCLAEGRAPLPDEYPGL